MKKSSKLVFWISFAAILFSFSPDCISQSDSVKGDPSDIELIEMLSLQDGDKVNVAIDKILERGEKMIPSLIKLRGDRRPFYGILKKDSNFATEGYLPSGNKKEDDYLIKKGKMVTVEVASLYLMTAIFYQSLDISQSPYLTDASLPARDRRAANTEGVVAKAWMGVDNWMVMLRNTSLSSLRKDNEHPLKNAKVRFW